MCRGPVVGMCCDCLRSNRETCGLQEVPLPRLFRDNNDSAGAEGRESSEGGLRCTGWGGG